VGTRKASLAGEKVATSTTVKLNPPAAEIRNPAARMVLTLRDFVKSPECQLAGFCARNRRNMVGEWASDDAPRVFDLTRECAMSIREINATAIRMNTKNGFAGSCPLVSVIVPVRDNPGGIRELIQCLTAQTISRDRFEVVIGDAGPRTPPETGPRALPAAAFSPSAIAIVYRNRLGWRRR
jgi:hypothetical protein